MGAHEHAEHPWRVAVEGLSRGAGILLDDRHVLTCAHVVGDEHQVVTVRSAVCRPEWCAQARVAAGAWVYRGDPWHADVTLLDLDEPAPCASRAPLWLAPISGGLVRAHGFPRAAELFGICADSELGGDGGRRGEFGLLNPVQVGRQWIEAGFSGAGVLKLDGDHAGHVIGMVAADFRNEEARAGWMLPTETILRYLPGVARYVVGEPTDRLSGPGDGLPELARGDTLRVALTRELARLLTGGQWAGTVVLPGGNSTGTSWLVRLVRTADPATRAVTTPADFALAPSDTVLGLGAIDAAYDARGRSVAEVMHYLAERFGLVAGDPVRQLLRREPPACIVIDGADRAADPGTLLRVALRPLASAARGRGMRLVLGFDGPVPESLPYEVLLDPRPVTGGARQSPEVKRADVEARVAELSAAEDGAAALGAAQARYRFRDPPALPAACAPSLRVRLAVTAGQGTEPESAAIEAAATAGLSRVASFRRQLEAKGEIRRGLRRRLEEHRARAARLIGAEDEELSVMHAEAAEALRQAPIDLKEADQLVERYVAEIERRRGDPGDEGAGLGQV